MSNCHCQHRFASRSDWFIRLFVISPRGDWFWFCNSYQGTSLFYGVSVSIKEMIKNYFYLADHV